MFQLPDFALVAVDFFLQALNLFLMVLYLLRVMLPQRLHLLLLLLPACEKTRWVKNLVEETISIQA